MAQLEKVNLSKCMLYKFVSPHNLSSQNRLDFHLPIDFRG